MTSGIRRVLVPIRSGRSELRHLEATLDPQFLDALGPTIEVTLLTVGADKESDVMTAFLDAVIDHYPARTMRQMVVVAPDPAEAILEAATGQDLVILGAPESPEGGPVFDAGPEGDGPILGPVVGDVIDRARVPLMVVWRHRFGEAPRRIVVPTDGTGRSRVAVDIALALAAGTSSIVTILQLIDPEGAPLGESDQANDRLGTEVEHSDGSVGPGVHFETGVVRSRDAVATIRATVLAKSCDLLVLGTHITSQGTGHEVSAPATELLRNPPCPIALVHVPDEPPATG